MKTLQNLFIKELSDMHDAEQRIVKALPKMIEGASSAELGEALAEHLEETKSHVEKVERVFAAFNEKPRNKTCEAIAGILKEGDSILTENRGEPTGDAAIIAACQKVEHYEMATYECLQGWADLLGNPSAVLILKEILEEEEAASQKLAQLAEELNQVALAD